MRGAGFGGARRGLAGDVAAERDELGGEGRVARARPDALAPHPASATESAAHPARTAARPRPVRTMVGDYVHPVIR